MFGGRAAMRSLAVLAVTCCLAVLACGREGREPNVIIIGMDTLRPDHLGCYGYSHQTSPNIDRLAGEGVIFKNTVSQSPWTLPSFGTVFTSLYPSQHGAGTLRKRVRTSFPTLAGILSESGYRTGAVVSASVLHSETGISRGFQDYAVPEGRAKRRADEVTDTALQWIDNGDGRPFFLFAHYWDAHDPYEPLPPYDTMFDPSYQGKIGNSFNPRGLMLSTASNIRSPASIESHGLSDEDLNHIISLYDGEIAFADKEIGRLLEGLEERGIRDNTLIVLLSDHGEEFFEHKGFGHGYTMFSEVIHVALILSLPEVVPGGRAIEEQARLVDVTPTILDLIGLDSGFAFEGASLVPLVTGKGKAVAGPHALFPPLVAYSEAIRDGPEKKAVTARPWKLIYDLASVDEVLFNLKEDPGESKDCMGQHPEAIAPLEELLSRALLELAEVWYVEIDPGGGLHSFDIAISAEGGATRGWICPFDLPNGDRRDLSPGAGVLRKAAGSEFEIRDLRPEGRVKMGFRIHVPRDIPTGFNFRIDGEPAAAETFIGESLINPEQVPFEVHTRRARAESASGPLERPQPPYILVWHVEGRYGGDIPANLSEEVKKELRALGYIQ